MNNIMELNELIYAEEKLVCGKTGVPLKNMNRNSKPGWEMKLETQMRNVRQQVKRIRQRKNIGICWDEKRKARQVKQTTQRNISEVSGEKRKTKKILRLDKTIKTKQDIPKQ